MKRYGTKLDDPEASVRATGASIPQVEGPLVSRIDAALRQFTGRHLVTSTEVIDLLLDLRFQIALDDALAEFLHAP